jgi:hypothetical protein
LIKPVMYYTVEQFLLLFNRLRKLLDEENRQVIITDEESVAKYKNKHISAVNDRLLKLFPRETEHVTTHVLRKLYAHMAWLEHGSKCDGFGGELW